MASDHNNIIYVVYIAGKYNNNDNNGDRLPVAVVAHESTTCFLAAARAIGHWLPWKLYVPGQIFN